MSQIGSLEKANLLKSKDDAIKWILLGIPVIIVLGFPLHFIYKWSGYNTVVGIFSPINESIWEHLKLGFWPILIWWVLGYLIIGNKNILSLRKWIVGCCVSEIVFLDFIVSFFYVYTGALGIHSLFLDILSFILGVAVAQICALYVYKYCEPSKKTTFICLIILILLMAAFVIFTFKPPHIPLFKDPISGQYGI